MLYRGVELEIDHDRRADPAEGTVRRVRVQRAVCRCCGREIERDLYDFTEPAGPWYHYVSGRRNCE